METASNEEEAAVILQRMKEQAVNRKRTNSQRELCSGGQHTAVPEGKNSQLLQMLTNEDTALEMTAAFGHW